MYDQVDGLKELVALTRYSQVEAPGYEADDIIGALAIRLADQHHEVLIVTTDNDMCQLLWHKNISIWMRASLADGIKKPWMKDNAWVQQKFGITADTLLIYRAFVGDKSDNIAPIPEVRTESNKVLLRLALRALSQVTDPTEALDLSDIQRMVSSPSSPLQFSVSPESKDQLASNYNLMRFHTPPELDVRRGEADPIKLHAELTRLGMKSLLGKVKNLTGKQHEMEP